MTPKQADYRNSLIEQKVNSVINSVSRENVASAIIAVNLPEPTTSAEASAQIDALKSGLQSYVKSNPALIAKVQSLFNQKTIDKVIEAKNFLPMDDVREYVTSNGKYNRVLSVLRGEL